MNKHLNQYGLLGSLFLTLICSPLTAEDMYSETPQDRADYLVPIGDDTVYHDEQELRYGNRNVEDNSSSENSESGSSSENSSEEQRKMYHPKVYGAYSQKDLDKAYELAEGPNAVAFLIFCQINCPPCKTILPKLKEFEKLKFSRKVTVIFAQGKGWAMSGVGPDHPNFWWIQLRIKFGVEKVPSMTPLFADENGKVKPKSSFYFIRTAYDEEGLFALLDRLIEKQKTEDN